MIQVKKMTARLLCALAFCGTANANLVVNGDFETGTYFGWTGSGTARFSSSTIVRGGVPGSSYYYDNGAIGSTEAISQALSTSTGSRYNLSFDYFIDRPPPANNPYGTGGPKLLDIEFGGSTAFTSSTGTSGWTHVNINGLTANSANTILTINSQNDPSGNAIDNLSVTVDAGPTLNVNRPQFVSAVGPEFGFHSTMDVALQNGAFVFKTNIDYVGIGIDQARLANYEYGIEKYWSNVRTVTIDGQEYPIVFDVAFRDANAGRNAGSNALLSISNDICRSKATLWCLRQEGEPVTAAQQEQLAAHEFGHLSMGLIDEYYEDGTHSFWGHQVGALDTISNTCRYGRPNGQSPKGDWCEDMMALGLDTAEDRYWTDIQAYLAGNIDRPNVAFGWAPIPPGIFDVPVERLPSEDLPPLSAVPEPGTPALLLTAMSAMILTSRRRKQKFR